MRAARLRLPACQCQSTRLPLRATIVIPTHLLTLQVDEEEREQLHGAVDAAMRHLDMTGEGFCASLISVCPRCAHVLAPTGCT